MANKQRKLRKAKALAGSSRKSNSRVSLKRLSKPSTSPSGVYAVVGVTGLQRRIGDARLFGERFIRFEIPDNIDEKYVRMMCSDLRTIGDVARKDRRRMATLLNAARVHDFGTAEKLARRIGLHEQRMVREGGGQIGIALVVLGVLVLGAYALGHESTGPTPEPVGPNPDPDPGPDAGPGD